MSDENAQISPATAINDPKAELEEISVPAPNQVAPESQADIEKQNFETGKKLSDFIGMVLRLGFLSAAFGYFIVMGLKWGSFWRIIFFVCALGSICLGVALIRRINNIILFELRRGFLKEDGTLPFYRNFISSGLTFIFVAGIITVAAAVAREVAAFNNVELIQVGKVEVVQEDEADVIQEEKSSD